MLNINRTVFKLIAILYLISLWSIFATSHIDGYQFLLKQMSHESSFFETVGTISLFVMFIYGVYALYKYSFNRYDRVTIIIFTILAFIAGMEEISWGQHIFHFPSSEYFLKNNMQDETNLHNLMDANLFSSIIYSSIYTILVFIPLLFKLSSYLQRFKFLKYFDIDPHTILVVLFASSFQLYFYNNIGVIVDMVTYLLALALFGYFLWVKRGNFWLKVHFITILIATVISILSSDIYSFFNMQYEIRESFIELAGVLIFVELIEKKVNS
jgi:hypothetical protein